MFDGDSGSFTVFFEEDLQAGVRFFGGELGGPPGLDDSPPLLQLKVGSNDVAPPTPQSVREVPNSRRRPRRS